MTKHIVTRCVQVDCTASNSEALCIKNRIDAFPTILVFRKDDTGTSQHESYHGERTVPAITGYVCPCRSFCLGSSGRPTSINPHFHTC